MGHACDPKGPEQRLSYLEQSDRKQKCLGDEMAQSAIVKASEENTNHGLSKNRDRKDSAGQKTNYDLPLRPPSHTVFFFWIGHTSSGQ